MPKNENSDKLTYSTITIIQQMFVKYLLNIINIKKNLTKNLNIDFYWLINSSYCMTYMKHIRNANAVNKL